MRCDQCEMLNINGVNCHEIGCPNAKKTWMPDREAWILFVECRECGCDVEVGECCGCCPETGGETESPFCLECDSAIDDQGNCQCDDEDDDEEPFCGDVRCNLPSNHTGPCQEGHDYDEDEDDDEDDDEDEAQTIDELLDNPR